jgi:hypothetical protein
MTRPRMWAFDRARKGDSPVSESVRGVFDLPPTAMFRGDRPWQGLIPTAAKVWPWSRRRLSANM